MRENIIAMILARLEIHALRGNHEALSRFAFGYDTGEDWNLPALAGRDIHNVEGCGTSYVTSHFSRLSY